MSLETRGSNFFGDEVGGIRIAFVDENGDIAFAKGAAVPADTTAWYAKGCIFIDTDGGVGSTFFVNEGSATSADFNAK